MSFPHKAVRPELVEGLFFLTAEGQVQSFDRLTTNGL